VHVQVFPIEEEIRELLAQGGGVERGELGLLKEAGVPPVKKVPDTLVNPVPPVGALARQSVGGEGVDIVGEKANSGQAGTTPSVLC
jgi:hypothetical protein